MITISAVGDIMLGDHPVRIGQGVRSTLEKTATGDLLGDVTRFLRGSTGRFGNLEVVHSDAGLVRERLESYEFRGAPSAIRTLRDAGFTVLSVANNHCMQHGVGAFEESASRLSTCGYHAARVEGRPGQVAAGHDRREWGAV